ncbi:MAG: hypothetical protein PHU85_15670, partial [Phycisphaerae bacterium]|nr:hypothetical protein [Phycisphaerae bacterium]
MMSEQFLSDSEAAALSGTTLSPGVPAGTYGAAAKAILYRLIGRIAAALVAPSACEVYKDDADDLEFGVRPGKLMQ